MNSTAEAIRLEADLGRAPEVMCKAALDQPCAEATPLWHLNRWPALFCPFKMQTGLAIFLVDLPCDLDLTYRV